MVVCGCARPYTLCLSARDPNQLAKLIVNLATGEAEDAPEDDGKDPAAVALGRKRGDSGGRGALREDDA
jgi:hypothetical protein